MNFKQLHTLATELEETRDKVIEALETLHGYNKHAKDANLDYAETLLKEAYEELNGTAWSLRHRSIHQQ